MINKHGLWDKDLSLQEVGLWARLLSRPDNWKIYVSELAKSCDLSDDTINKIIRGLIEKGYAARVQKRQHGLTGNYPNRFAGYEYWIFERRMTKEEISNILSEPVFSAPINDGPDKVGTNKTDCSPDKDSEEVVRYQTPKGADVQKEKPSDLDKQPTSTELTYEAIQLPSSIKTTNPKGAETTINLNDVFLHSLKTKKDWDTKEIQEAWKILSEFEGKIYAPMQFIEGTIKNIRMSKKSLHLQKQGKKCLNEEIMKYDNYNVKSSGNDMKEQPSLASLLKKPTTP